LLISTPVMMRRAMVWRNERTTVSTSGSSGIFPVSDPWWLKPACFQRQALSY
jgi:hypothetical protein